ncbi:MAG: ABC transporter substrate-binding protein, partial [Phormidesmis sp.]
MLRQPRFFRQRFRRVVLALLALTLSVVLANCGGADEATPSAEEAAAPAATGALVYGAGGQPVNLTPGNITDGNSIVVQKQIYNYLTGTEPGTTDPAPELATEWNASEDGLTWTFTLQEGVKFHDGTDFDAEAVVFNVNRWWDPEFEFGFRDEGNLFEIWTDLFGGYKGSEESTLTGVQAVDASKVEFQLKEPFAAFPAAIGSGYFGIGSPTAMQE